MNLLEDENQTKISTNIIRMYTKLS